MANWTRRRLIRGALTLASTSLLLLNQRSGRADSASCGSYNYYDPYDCNPDFPCNGGGGDGGGGDGGWGCGPMDSYFFHDCRDR